MQPDHDTFFAQLRAAFPAQPIRSTDAFDEFGIGYPDAVPYKAAIDGTSWDELDRTYLVRRCDALGFLGTEHLVAVLPLYLGAMVEGGVWSPATGMLMVLLARPLPGEDTGLGHERFDALLSALTDTQRAATALALHVFASGQPPDDSPTRLAREALDRCWTTYLRGTR